MGKSRKHRQDKRSNRVAQIPVVESLEFFSYRSEGLTLRDCQDATNQLGYIPTNLVEIGARNPATNLPWTLVLYGLNQNDTIKGRYSKGIRQPFPTIIWMSCPELKAKISKLEDQGLVTVFQEKLMNPPVEEESSDHLLNFSEKSYLQQMEEAHLRYAEERWNTLSDSDREFVMNSGWEDSLGLDLGIAGIRNPSQVKCLHTHYAHYLTRPSHNNVIGKWVHHALLDMERRNLDESSSNETIDLLEVEVCAKEDIEDGN
jgi:uncharacterized protein